MKMFDQIPKPKNKRIKVVSLDMDDCLFNRNYNWLPECSALEVINKNRVLLDFIKSQALHYNELIAFVGSARQTKKIDMLCSTRYKTESAFIAIKKVASYLNAKLDDFLLADIYFNLDAGTSMQRANDELYQDEHSIGPNDHTKFTLLYAQTHKIANQYPNTEIIFDFYDDGGVIKAKILHDLLEYFSELPDKLPHNVVLNLIHYEGHQTSLIGFIKGTGFIDENYRRTVHEITRMSRRYISMGNEAITKGTLRLDDRVFLYRKALKPTVVEEEKITTELMPTEASTPPAIEPMPILNLPFIMVGILWGFWVCLISYSTLDEDEVDEQFRSVLG